jgi:cytoskeleton protein RodZ
MALSLGEKLRMAREERGISISEVAEQTRISPLYLEAIDQDNYKSLPGGIFNKGFVRSYAKYVGIDEQEALQDYSRIIAESVPVEEPEFKTYRPEVLTDDRAATSIVPTVIFAAVILALMSAGILFLVNYIQNQQSEPPIAANQINANSAQPDRPGNTNALTTPLSGTPVMGSVKVEFAAVGDAVSLTSVVDRGKSTEVMLQPGNPVVFEPKESLDLRYHRSRAQYAQLRVNGKPIALPAQPKPGQSTIEVKINQGNIAQIWDSGQIGGADTPPASTEAPAQRPTPRPATPRTAASNSNAGPPTMTGRPPVRPAATPTRRPANTER